MEEKKKTKTKELLERCSKEEIVKLYLDECKSMPEIAEHFNITCPQLRNLLTLYGIKKDRQKAAKTTKRRNLERYGVESTNQLQSV